MAGPDGVGGGAGGYVVCSLFLVSVVSCSSVQRKVSKNIARATNTSRMI